jgi:F-type H+-transporting ATPase subunit a
MISTIKKYITLSFLLAAFSTTVASAQDHTAETEHGTQEEKAFNPAEMILHHISDSHGFHLWGEGHSSVTVPLPVILYTENNGVDVFMSSEFHHGEDPVVRGENTYVLDHNKIYLANADGTLDYDEEHHATNERPLDFSITKNVFALLFSATLMLLIFISVARFYKREGNVAPKGLASFMEPLIVFVRDEIALPNIGEKKYAKFLPYLLSVFFFIWINNLLGLIPIFPGSANLTGNIALTMVLAGITMVITNINGNKDYWKHIFNTPGVPWWLKYPLPLMPVVEFIGVLSKPFALMIRLFANITAGHIIILSLISLIFIFENAAWAGLSVPFALFMNVLELLVAALQAYIFTLLSALFIGMAVEEHDHAH